MHLKTVYEFFVYLLSKINYTVQLKHKEKNVATVLNNHKRFLLIFLY